MKKIGLVAVVAVVCLAVAIFVYLKPWTNEEDGDNTVGEDVWFLYEASFTYRGSENNLPIENVALRFPCPNVENVAVPTYTTWSLYYLDNENVLHLEATENGDYEFMGDRTATLEILLHGITAHSHGPKIGYVLDKLYPQEIFWIIVLASVPEENANKLTLRDYGDNDGRSSMSYDCWGKPFQFPINVSVWAQLSQQIAENYSIVETFSRIRDNLAGATLWLYPS